MQENSTKPRPGTGCAPDAGGVIEPEVLPAYFGPGNDGQVRIGRVHFDRTTTLESPWFWMLVGTALGAAASYFILREKNRR